MEPVSASVYRARTPPPGFGFTDSSSHRSRAAGVGVSVCKIDQIHAQSLGQGGGARSSASAGCTGNFAPVLPTFSALPSESQAQSPSRALPLRGAAPANTALRSSPRSASRPPAVAPRAVTPVRRASPSPASRFLHSGSSVISAVVPRDVSPVRAIPPGVGSIRSATRSQRLQANTEPMVQTSSAPRMLPPACMESVASSGQVTIRTGTMASNSSPFVQDPCRDDVSNIGFNDAVHKVTAQALRPVADANVALAGDRHDGVVGDVLNFDVASCVGAESNSASVVSNFQRIQPNLSSSSRPGRQALCSLATEGLQSRPALEQTSLDGKIAVSHVVFLRGKITVDTGVVQVQQAPGEAVWLVFREPTARWLVVQSTVNNVPLGSTLAHCDDPSALLASSELRLRPPTWVPVLKPGEVEAVYGAAAVGPQVRRLIEGKKAPRRLLVVCGPPNAGKTMYARSRPELFYDDSVVLSTELAMEPAWPLFRRIACGRRRACEDHFEKEAFLIESLDVYNRFVPFAEQVLWRAETSALSEALRLGVGIVVESDGSSFESRLEAALKGAQFQQYRTCAFCLKAPSEVLRRRAEARFDDEVRKGVLLGGRNCDALLDLLARRASSQVDRLTPFVDEILCVSCDTPDVLEAASPESQGCGSAVSGQAEGIAVGPSSLSYPVSFVSSVHKPSHLDINVPLPARRDALPREVRSLSLEPCGTPSTTVRPAPLSRDLGRPRKADGNQIRSDCISDAGHSSIMQLDSDVSRFAPVVRQGPNEEIPGFPKRALLLELQAPTWPAGPPPRTSVVHSSLVGMRSTSGSPASSSRAVTHALHEPGAASSMSTASTGTPGASEGGMYCSRGTAAACTGGDPGKMMEQDQAWLQQLMMDAEEAASANDEEVVSQPRAVATSRLQLCSAGPLDESHGFRSMADNNGVALGSDCVADVSFARQHEGLFFGVHVKNAPVVASLHQSQTSSTPNAADVFPFAAPAPAVEGPGLERCPEPGASSPGSLARELARACAALGRELSSMSANIHWADTKLDALEAHREQQVEKEVGFDQQVTVE